MAAKMAPAKSIKMFVATATLIALPGGFGIIKAALNYIPRLASRDSQEEQPDTIWLAQRANGLISLRVIHA